MGANIQRSPAEVLSAPPYVTEAALYELRPPEHKVFAADMEAFMGSEPLDVSRQREIMLAFWKKFGLEVPSVTGPLTELDATVDLYRKKSRLVAFPLLPDLRGYEALGEIARQVLPKQGFNPNYQPVVVEDNDHGLFPRFVADPEATIAGADGQKYVQRYTTPEGELATWSEYVGWLEEHGHAVQGHGGIAWGFLGRDMTAEAPPQLALTMNLLKHANGAVPDEHGMTATNAGIYRQDVDGEVDPRPARTVDVYWHGKKGQIRVISGDSLYGSPLKRSVDPFIGRILTERHSSS